MTDEEFLSAMTVCRVLPGANQVNLAVFVGARLRGVPARSSQRPGCWPRPDADRVGARRALYRAPAVSLRCRRSCAA